MNMDIFDIIIVLHIKTLKQILYTVMKLLLTLLIFSGLQGRVLVRYAEVFNHHTGHEMYTQKGTNVQAEVVHCKLQCFTKQFHFMAVPGIPYLLIFILFAISVILVFLPFGERPVHTDTFQRAFLRGPPLLN